MDVSKLPKMDPDVEHQLRLLDRLLKTRRAMAANASRKDFSIPINTQLEAEQGALFRELHENGDRLDIKFPER